MRYLLVFALATIINFSANAQSMFKPLPKITYTAANPFARATTPLPDSTFTGFRFTGPMVLYALPNSTVFTGIGADYEHDVFNSTTGKWSTIWAIAIGGYEGGQIAPSSVSAVTAVGVSVAFFNKLLTIGVLYNISNKNFQGAVGPSVSLNN
jgi:hypothetical protein